MSRRQASRALEGVALSGGNRTWSGGQCGQRFLGQPGTLDRWREGRG